MSFPVRPIQDNVFIALEARPNETASGLSIVRSRDTEKRGTRNAVVLAVGPGHTTKQGVFIPTTVKVGERVMVPALAGQDWSLDFDAPRQRASAEHPDEASFPALYGHDNVRCVREEEILCVLE